MTGLLKWVRKEDEKEIRTVFAASLAVRVKGKEARELAGRFLFETLVRVHRAGEGAGGLMGGLVYGALGVVWKTPGKPWG